MRRVLKEGLKAGSVDLFGEDEDLDTSLASALLAPTRIYVKPILNLLRDDFPVHGMVHVTGGGFVGNIPRILPQGVRARIDPDAWTRPGVFAWIQKRAELPGPRQKYLPPCPLSTQMAPHSRRIFDPVRRMR